MGEGWGEGEESGNSSKLFIPLPFIPSRQGRGYSFLGDRQSYQSVEKEPQLILISLSNQLKQLEF